MSCRYAADPNHARAVDLLRKALDDGERLVTPSYVVVEAAALIQRRLGLNAAVSFLRETQHLGLYWVTPLDHEQAIDLLEPGNRGLSLVDCGSFTIMRRLDLNIALAFDADFERAGFALYG